ncbi:MAG: hypothetical protein ACYSX0_01445 [Planctomycetota bacterium]|jgi:hypothetical protein
MPPDGAVARALEYVGLLFFLCLASTFPFWVAAQLARSEYRRLMSALAFSMRVFFYSVCLLCILVALRSFDLAPRDPRSTLFGWIHLGGTLLICAPSAWRAFRVTRVRLVLLLVAGWGLCAVLLGLGIAVSDSFADRIVNLPRYLSRA